MPDPMMDSLLIFSSGALKNCDIVIMIKPISNPINIRIDSPNHSFSIESFIK